MKHLLLVTLLFLDPLSAFAHVDALLSHYHAVFYMDRGSVIIRGECPDLERTSASPVKCNGVPVALYLSYVLEKMEGPILGEIEQARTSYQTGKQNVDLLTQRMQTSMFPEVSFVPDLLAQLDSDRKRTAEYLEKWREAFQRRARLRDFLFKLVQDPQVRFEITTGSERFREEQDLASRLSYEFNFVHFPVFRCQANCNYSFDPKGKSRSERAYTSGSTLEEARGALYKACKDKYNGFEVFDAECNKTASAYRPGYQSREY